MNDPKLNDLIIKIEDLPTIIDFKEIKKIILKSSKYIRKRLNKYKKIIEILNYSYNLHSIFLDLKKKIIEIEFLEKFYNEKKLVSYKFFLDKLNENYLIDFYIEASNNFQMNNNLIFYQDIEDVINFQKSIEKYNEFEFKFLKDFNYQYQRFILNNISEKKLRLNYSISLSRLIHYFLQIKRIDEDYSNEFYYLSSINNFENIEDIKKFIQDDFNNFKEVFKPIYLADFLTSTNILAQIEYHIEQIKQEMYNNKKDPIKRNILAKQVKIKASQKIKNILLLIDEIDNSEIYKIYKQEYQFMKNFVNYQNQKFQKFFFEILEKIKNIKE